MGGVFGGFGGCLAWVRGSPHDYRLMKSLCALLFSLAGFSLVCAGLECLYAKNGMLFVCEKLSWQRRSENQCWPFVQEE